MSKFIIYKYTSPKKKSYIGYTNNPKQRAKDHRKKEWDFEDTTKFAHCIRKYGFENLEYEEIDAAETLEEIGEKEKYWIKFYDSVNSGYNICEGGFSPLNQTHDDRVVEDIRTLLRANRLTIYQIANTMGVSATYVSEIGNGKVRGNVKIERVNLARKGSANGQSKLTEDSVKAIKDELSKGTPRKEIQRLFGVSKTLIQMLAIGEIWQHVVSDYVYVAKEENGNAKLTKEIVANIKKDLREGVLMKKEIFAKYGISRATLTQIQTGKTWKEVE